MNSLVKQLSIAAVGLAILIATLFIPKTVYNKDEMKNVELGYPIPFITQDFTRYDPPFPYRYSFGSPWEDPYRVLWNNFLLSYVTVLLFLEAIFYGKKYLF